MSVEEQLQEIIQKYDFVIKNLDQEAKDQKERAYGGYVRAKKGELQEYITESLAKIAWESLEGDINQFEINSKKIALPIQQKYVEKIEDQNVKKHIKNNIENYVYKLSVDKHIFIKGRFVIAIECKAFTENAMLKRILVDFDLLQSKHPDLSCYLFQLESQLGGDYSKLKKPTYGSHSTHTIQSYFSCDLNIITLLPGERKVGNPIHKEGYFKPLKIEALKEAVEILKKDMKRFL